MKKSAWKSLITCIIIFVVALLISGVAAGFIYLKITHAPDGDDPIGSSWAMVVGFLFAAFAVWLFKKDTFSFKSIKETGRPWSIMLLVLVFFIGYYFIDRFSGDILCELFPESMDDYNAGERESGTTLIVVIASCIAAPIGEETFFRGIAQRYLQQIVHPFLAIAIISILFGVAHMNLVQGTLAALSGVFFGWIYYKTGILWSSILGHVLLNTIATVGEFTVGLTSVMTTKDFIIDGLLFVVGIAAVWFAGKKICYLMQTEEHAALS